MPWRRPSALPGFGLTMGCTLAYLGLVVLLPLSALIGRAAFGGLNKFVGVLSDPRVQSALLTTFGLAAAAAITSALFGFLVAWVLTRYRFPGRRLFDAAVDLPFALPTAVAGIALTALYAPNGWVGHLLGPLGVKVAFTRLGIFVALVFVALPFSVRTVQPLIGEIDRELEEASATLGAGRAETVWRAVLPPLVPGIITGFVLAFSRAVGEYGSVIFIAGNVPYVSEIAPLLVVIRLEEYDFAGATAIATAMLGASFVTLLLINGVEAASRRRLGQV